jgi:CheY-like chemotaxis protein
MEPAMSLGNNGEVSAPLILVVDDDEDTREVCAMTLRLAGFRTEEAGNGAVACERAFVLEPDAILLDHSMPVMDGREAARRLRADTRTHNAALVMMTGFNAATVKGREVRADGHCDAYLSKPGGADEVVASLRASLLSRAGGAAAAATAPKQQTS